MGVTESFDGTSWTEVADLATARRGSASGTIGTSTAGLCGAGLIATPALSNLTEEWTLPAPIEIKTFTSS